jgi:hypothetical protein
MATEPKKPVKGKPAKESRRGLGLTKEHAKRMIREAPKMMKILS